MRKWGGGAVGDGGDEFVELAGKLSREIASLEAGDLFEVGVIKGLTG
jgi:hypothetical protein